MSASDQPTPPSPAPVPAPRGFAPGRATGAELLRHASWVRGLAVSLVVDAASADDLVQDTWAAALAHPPTTDRPLGPWLGRVLRNVARQGRRASGRRAAREQERPAPPELPGPEEIVQRLDAERALFEALAALEEPYRSTLILCFYEGLEPSELARKEGIAPATVRWRKLRGLELLRERLDRRYEGDRRSWCLAFLPLARLDPSALSLAGLSGAGAAAATVAVPTAAALAMNAILKTTVLLAALVLLAVGLSVGGLLPPELIPWERAEPPLELAFRDLPPREVAAADDPRALPQANARRTATSSATTPVAEPAPPAALSPDSARLDLRVTDELGNALAGVDVEVQLPAPRGTRGVRTRTDGRASFDLDLSVFEGKAMRADVRVLAESFASFGDAVQLAPGDELDLGTIVLRAGGAVSGRVLDERGLGVPGATVAFGPADTMGRVLEQERFHGGPHSIPQTTTDAEGRFLLVGMPVGFARLWARGEGYLASYTRAAEVRAGKETLGVELVLSDLRPENRIRLIVLDPEGRPVPRARLEFRVSSEETGTTRTGEETTANDGTYAFIGVADTRLSVTAHAPDGDRSSATVTDVATGGPELVLVLREPELASLVVTNTAGEPLESYALDVLSPDGAFVYSGFPRAARPAGRASFPLPSEPFIVRATAPRHAIETTSRIVPRAGRPVELALELEPVPGIHGFVLDGSEPVPGAEVRLFQVEDDDVRVEVNGFLVRTTTDELDETMTDEDGAFVITVRRMGEYVLRVDAGGFAPTEWGPFLVEGDVAFPELEIVLWRGGALEGRVRGAQGEDVAGTIVGISRGDGFGRTARVASDGRYRFARLTPGPWQVVIRDEEIWTNSLSTSRTSGDGISGDTIDWTCEVYEGETTFHDLELGTLARCTLEGRLTVDRADARAWSAKLIPGDQPIFSEAPKTTVAPDGSFRLGSERGGPTWLVLNGMFEQLGEHMLVAELDLVEGLSTWEFALETGSLVVEGVPAVAEGDMPAAVYLWEGPQDAFYLLAIEGDDEGACRIPVVPAGRAKLVRPDRRSMDPRGWEPVLEFEVPVGGDVTVRVPD